MVKYTVAEFPASKHHVHMTQVYSYMAEIHLLANGEILKPAGVSKVAAPAGKLPPCVVHYTFMLLVIKLFLISSSLRLAPG